MIEWLAENEYLYKNIEIDNHVYSVYYKQKTSTTVESPKIAIVSYQPNDTASELLHLCIRSIKKFTGSDYELWIVDNNSPEENIKWLDDQENTNLVFIRTEPHGEASFANGLALEVAVRLIDPETKYFMTLHEDTIVSRYGWLEYLTSKLNKKTKAAGFRLTKARIPEGVLHVCGYMIDFQTYKELNLSFLPELPDFDIGDKVIYELKKKGFNIFAALNTFDNEDSIKNIPDTMGIYGLNTTRAFNDKNEVIYMHLGRGIPKARGEYRNKEKSSSAQWIEYIRRYLFSEPVLPQIDIKSVKDFDFSDCSISDFFKFNFFDRVLRNIDNLDDFKVLHIGGSSGYFKKYNFTITGEQDLSDNINYLNMIILEGISKRSLTIEEMIDLSFKNLIAGGVLVLSVPFLKADRPDPDRMNTCLDRTIRYLWNTGFREVSAEKYGTSKVFELQADVEKFANKNKNNLKKDLAINRYIKRRLSKIINHDNHLIKRNIFDAEIKTIGYGVIAVK